MRTSPLISSQHGSVYTDYGERYKIEQIVFSLKI